MSLVGATKNLLRPGARAMGAGLRSAGILLPEAVFRHLHFTGPFNVVLPNGISVRLMSWGNTVENELFWRGWRGHEQDVMPWWLTFAHQGGDVLDIGANTGTFGLFAKAVCPSARVQLFEPIPRIAEMAEINAKTSGLEVKVINKAVADSNGELLIHDPGGENAYSASLYDDFISGDKASYSVSVTTVDEHCSAYGLSPRTIKVDVEGAEGCVIIGAVNTLRRNECRIVCEWLGNSSSNSEAISLLEQLGYAAFDPLTLTQVNLGESRSSSARNVLIVKRGSEKTLQRLWH